MNVQWFQVDKNNLIDTCNDGNLFWVYTKTGQTFIARFQWRQGWAQDLFVSINGITMLATEVTHVAPYVAPTPYN